MDERNIEAALRKMKPHQARAWMLYFCAKRAGITSPLKFIAWTEGVTFQAIHKRLNAGIQYIRKINSVSQKTAENNPKMVERTPIYDASNR